MSRRHRITRFALFVILLVLGVAVASAQMDNAMNQMKSGMKNMAMVKEGEHLVTIGGCNDCHSPKIMTSRGPVADTTRLLSGHPANESLPPLPDSLIAPNKWGAITSNDFTAWYGPWGVSYAANLTPDKGTGIGSWKDATFIKALRTGKHLGEGRQILPPMPWFDFAKMTDQELKAVFSYLQSLKPIENAVPEPQPPTAKGQGGR